MDIDKVGTENSPSNRDKLDNEGFRKLMLAFGDSYPIDKVFASLMSTRLHGDQSKGQISLLIYSELRRIRYCLEEIAKKK